MSVRMAARSSRWAASASRASVSAARVWEPNASKPDATTAHERRDIQGLRVPEKPSRFGRACARPATSKLLQIESPTASSAQVLPPAGTALTPANQRVALAASNFHSLALEDAFLTRNARASAVA